MSSISVIMYECAQSTVQNEEEANHETLKLVVRLCFTGGNITTI